MLPCLISCAGGGGSAPAPNTVTQSDALRAAQSADVLGATLSVSPSSLSLALPTPQTLTVTVTKLTTVSATSSDPNVATISPASVSVDFLTAGLGTATFTVTPNAVGSARMRLSDLQGTYAVVPVTVQAATNLKNLLFVANATANSVTAYPLDGSGNIAPVRAIAGPATLLSHPQSIAVDSNGTTWVLNSSGTVTAYAPGAQGNVAPIHHFASPSKTGAIAVSHDGSHVLLAMPFPNPAPYGNAGVGTYDVNGALKYTVFPAGDENRCGIGGINCGNQPQILYHGVAFAQDGSIASGAFYELTPDSQGSNFDDLPSTSTSGLVTPNFSLGLYGDPLAAGFLMDAGFAYEATTNVIAAAAIFNGANAGEVLVAPWSKGAGYSRIIGSQNNASAQLDQNIGGVAIGADGTVYVASTTGYVNVFGPAASGDVAPERRIIGTSTALSSPDALAIYPPQ